MPTNTPLELAHPLAYSWLPGGGVGVIVSLECQRFLAEILIVIYPHKVLLMRRYGRRNWSL